MYRRNGRRGYALALAVVATATLLGVAILTVDLGMLVASQQKVQDSVDAAALAGAQHLPAQYTAADWACKSVAANDAEIPNVRLQSSETEDIVCYEGGETISGYGTLGPDVHAIKVRSTGKFDYTFAKALGWETGQVTCSATAIGKNTSGWGTIFAEELIHVDNAHIEISGATHSNDDLNFDGADGYITGTTTYVDSLYQDACGVDFDKPKDRVDVQPRPTDCRASDFLVDYDITAGDDPSIIGASCQNGNITASEADTVDFPAGVYECNDLVLRECGSVTGHGVSFVVHGRVVFDNNGPIDLSFAQHDMALYVTGDQEYAVELDNGDPIDITGGVCAPYGGVYFDHAKLKVTNGVLYANKILIDQAGTIVNTVERSYANHVELVL